MEVGYLEILGRRLALVLAHWQHPIPGPLLALTLLLLLLGYRRTRGLERSAHFPLLRSLLYRAMDGSIESIRLP
jgi:putative effector of murein hydrolase LrgA (UPF0299 family)